MQNAKTCQGLAELEILVPPRELEAPKATVTSLGWFANEGRKLWKMLCVCVCVCFFVCFGILSKKKVEFEYKIPSGRDDNRNQL